MFPSGDVTLCEQLGLSLPDEQSIPEGEAIRQLNDQLAAHFTSHTCVPLEQAKRDINRILENNGFGDWTIELIPTSPDRPCAGFGVDAQQQTIHVIPIPDPN